MTLGKLVLYVAVLALVLTVLVVMTKKSRNWFLSYLQNFAGTLFIVSGWVKAIDPLGTAFKMEQYFAEFQSTFADTWFSFLASVFPLLSEYAIGFSVFMIVLEIVLGLALILGARPKWAAWLFLLIIAFFSFLTGFTFLTGYVPEGVNFFSFSEWGAYDKNNMKVTDCGCFGDFLKLEPKVSFFKDIVLLVPALLFVFFSKRMHQLLNPLIRTVILFLATAGLLFYCLSNYSWDLPHTDFRPFKEGTDVANQLQAEREASANAPVSYQLVNKAEGKEVTLSMDEFMKEYKKYPKEEWEYNQIKGKPAIPITKISDFAIDDPARGQVTDSILQKKGPHFMIVSYKMPSLGEQTVQMMAFDTLFRTDTIILEVSNDTQLVRSVVSVDEVPYETTVPVWKDPYLKSWKDVLQPFVQKAQESGIPVYAVTKPMDPDPIQDFKGRVGADYPFYQADDILLKTIIRSNPGFVLWKDGVIVKKWHYKQLPDFEEVQKKWL